jgi:hypothetical protein
MSVNTLLLLLWGVLWSTLQWLLGNFIYGWLIAYLDKYYNIKEANVIASVSSYIIPAIISCAVIAFVYLLGQHSGIVAQGTDMTNKREAIASALDNLAQAVTASPSAVIGSQSIAVAKPGSSGTVIGSQSVAIGQPGFSGTVIGSQSVASSSGTPVNAQKAKELRNGAERVRAGHASRSEIETLIAQSFLPGKMSTNRISMV